MENLTNISYLNVRASYGLNASYGSATNSTAILKTQLTNRLYLSDQEVAIAIQNLENSELTWEKKYEANLGVDIGLFGGRLNITTDVYKRYSFDLISLIKTAGIGGEVYKMANYADLKSKGIEFTLNAKPIVSRNLNWSTQFTFGYNKNEITNQKNAPVIFDLVIPEGGALVGYPVRGLFSVDFAGLDPQNGTPLYVNDKGVVSNNVYLKSDAIGNLKYEGSVDPTITGGLNNTLNYGNFSLGFLLTYQTGNKIRLYPSFKEYYSDLDAMPGEFKNRWTLPGDERVTNIPAIADIYTNFQLGDDAAYPYNTYNYSSARVVDGSFVRLKTASLAYSLPQKLIKPIGLNNVSVNLVGNNLWLIYSDPKLRGQDPEFFNAGGVALPINKQFVVSLKVGL
jgi:hypothetical protein